MQLLSQPMANILYLIFLSFSYFHTNYSHTFAKTEYVCTPCGYDCDTQVYTEPGNCHHCRMKLVEKSSVVYINISPDDLCQIVATNKNVVLLDVRSPAEFNVKDKEKFGRLKNAINIPVDDLVARVSELKQYKNKEIIVYCSHSHRSPRASQILTSHGFANVKNMSGGMSVWNDSVTKKDCKTALLVK